MSDRVIFSMAICWFQGPPESLPTLGSPAVTGI